MRISGGVQVAYVQGEDFTIAENHNHQLEAASSKACCAQHGDRFKADGDTGMNGSRHTRLLDDERVTVDLGIWGI